MDVRGMATGPCWVSIFVFKEAAAVEALGERTGLRMEVTGFVWSLEPTQRASRSCALCHGDETPDAPWSAIQGEQDKRGGGRL